MAHECILCGNTCRCGGDIDDLLLPNPNCKGCSCERDAEDEDLVDFECDFFPDPIHPDCDNNDGSVFLGGIDPVNGEFQCLECGNYQDHEGDCERCGGSFIDHQPQ